MHTTVSEWEKCNLQMYAVHLLHSVNNKTNGTVA